MDRSDMWVEGLLDRARIAERDVVVDVGPQTGVLAAGALARLGPDGSVVCLEHDIDRLEALLSECSDPRLAFLVGGPDVLPLPDASADVALGGPSSPVVTKAFADELHRVLRPQGRVSLCGEIDAGDPSEILAEAGFSEVASVRDTWLFLAGRKP